MMATLHLAEADDPLLDRDDPLSMITPDDPYPAYRRIREAAPLWRSGAGYWVTADYAVVRDVLRHPDFGQDYSNRVRQRLGENILDNISFSIFSRQFTMADPPRHTRMRAMVADAFTARSMERLEAFMARIADTYLERMAGMGEFDLMREFAHPYPCEIVCRLLGMPDEMLPYFLEETRVTSRIVEPTPPDAEELAEVNRAYTVLQDSWKEILKLRRRHPGDDWTSKLLEDGTLDEDDIIPQMTMLFAGGFDTMTDFIGGGFLAMHKQPDAAAALGPGTSKARWRSAVEEVLRIDAPIQIVSRVAMKDGARIGGLALDKGEVVVVLLAGANHDPKRYPDPERLDFDRDAHKQMAFGGGIHTCLGAQMSRVEGGVILKKLLGERWRFEVTQEEFRYRPNIVRRGLERLTGRLQPAG